MDISLSRLNIAQAIKTRTDEISALQDSLDLLNNTYKAEFTSLETAQKEANDKSAEVQVEKQKTINVESETAHINDLNIELNNRVVTAEAKIIEHEATIAQLKMKKTDLAVENDTLKADLKTATDKVIELSQPVEPLPLNDNSPQE